MCWCWPGEKDGFNSEMGPPFSLSLHVHMIKFHLTVGSTNASAVLTISTLAHVHKHVYGIPYFNHITLMHVFLAMKKVITEPNISFMEMTFSTINFNKVTFRCVFLEIKKMIAEPTISLMEMTFGIVHLVVSAPIQPIAVFAKPSNLWFHRKAILATSWFHQTAVITTSPTFDYRLFDVLRLQFYQLTDVTGKKNSFLHLIHESFDPFHTDATSFHTISRTVIIPRIASIASCFVVLFSPAYHPVQISFGHTFASFLL